jgi:peptidoglycan/LPS O-acetylase OafA/YrhL
VPTPRPFRILAVIAALEGLALLVNGVLVAVSGLTGGSYGATGDSTTATIIEVVIFLVLGAGLLVVASGWYRAQRWARGPFVLAQLIGLFAGVSFIFSGDSAAVMPGLVLAVPSLIGLVVTFSPGVVRTFSQSYQRPGSGS